MIIDVVLEARLCTAVLYIELSQLPFNVCRCCLVDVYAGLRRGSFTEWRKHFPTRDAWREVHFLLEVLPLFFESRDVGIILILPPLKLPTHPCALCNAGACPHAGTNPTRCAYRCNGAPCAGAIDARAEALLMLRGIRREHNARRRFGAPQARLKGLGRRAVCDSCTIIFGFLHLSRSAGGGLAPLANGLCNVRSFPLRIANLFGDIARG